MTAARCSGPGAVDERRTIDDVLAAARAKLPHRVAAHELDGLIERGALVVDTRPAHQREVDGELAGALVIDRNVLEWRLDPASPNHIAEASGYEIDIVVVCNEGYSSSLAAATLQLLGLHGATDLDGGYQAYMAYRTAQGRRAASAGTS